MALPVVDTDQPDVKKLIQEGVKDIANMIFKSASVSITAAAKAVTPSIPEMVADITEDLRAGPVNRFSKGLEKLDKLLQNFGSEIKDYSKELANFVTQREARIDKSEKTIRELRESNVKAEIDDMGNIQILSKFEIQQKEKLLEKRTTEIKELQDKIDTNKKLVQEEKGNTKARREAIVKSQETIIEKEKERAKIIETLNKTEEDASDDAKMTIRERASNFVEEYVPDGLRDIGSQFMEGLMAPITAVKELGGFFGGLLKPLKALPKLFKKFIGGLIEGEGTAELVYDNAASGETATFVDGVLTTGDAGTASFELFPDSASGSAKISVSGLITNFEQSSALGDVNTISITFKPSGTITSAI